MRKVKVKITGIIPGKNNSGHDGYKLNGYNLTDSKPFGKFIFGETRDGQVTQLAEDLGNFNKGDYVFCTVDDTQWENVKKIEAAPAEAGGGGGGNRGGYKKGGGNGNQMTKEEWAEKDRKKRIDVSRSVALKTASAIVGAGKAPTKKDVESIEKLTHRMFNYLMTGDFDTEYTGPKPEPKEDPRPASTEAAGAPGPEDVPTTPAGADDDIPF